MMSEIFPPLANQQLPFVIDGKCGQVSDTLLVAAIIAKQQQLRQASATTALISEQDFAEFSTSLLACIYLGVDVVFAANAKSETINALKDKVDIAFVDSPTEQPAKIANEIIYQPTDINITLYTSGSTAAPKAINKKLSNFTAEAKALDELWGNYAKDAVFLASVSHQHIYGMLFKFFWASERANSNSNKARQRVWQDLVGFEERLHYLLGHYQKAIFISSPAFLKRLTVKLATSQAQRLACVFSSGGLLTQNQSEQAEHLLGSPCLRILGSTETGGIAYQDSASPLWTIFPNVQTKVEDNVLYIASPYCYQSAWYKTADQAEKVGRNQLIHKGRVDDVVKIEEKRVSLSEIENRLRANPYVDDAKLVLLERKRLMLAAVVVLSAKGKEKCDLDKQLKKYLADYFEDVTVPKLFRFVDKIPENAQGKVLKSALLALFN